jgi:hypothetical protein
MIAKQWYIIFGVRVNNFIALDWLSTVVENEREREGSIIAKGNISATNLVTTRVSLSYNCRNGNCYAEVHVQYVISVLFLISVCNNKLVQLLSILIVHGYPPIRS